jgi:peptidoglycan hydrolase-like protein with peptidoglycan-binding domain
MNRRPAPRRAALVTAFVAATGLASAACGQLPGLPPADGSSAAAATPGGMRSTATVTRRSMTIEETLDGTLAFGGERKVVNGLGGTLTWLPAAGAIVRRGERLYEVDGRRRPVLMYGSRPAWRRMDADVSNGADVRQLEDNLAALGHLARSRVDSSWDARTTSAVKRWQKASGQSVDGVVELGEVVFMPGPIRVTERPVDVGTPLAPGAVVLSGTGDERVVTVDLAADRTGLVKAGDQVTVELPDGTTAGATVAEIGSVAKAANDQFGQPGTPTVRVRLALDDPKAAEAFTYAPVDVHIVRSRRDGVLAVPVNALLALLEGGYAVEVVEPDGTSQLVGVRTGIFQDGWVEVTPAGDGLAEGDLVAVPT